MCPAKWMCDGKWAVPEGLRETKPLTRLFIQPVLGNQSPVGSTMKILLAHHNNFLVSSSNIDNKTIGKSIKYFSAR